jgi:zinc protease
VIFYSAPEREGLAVPTEADLTAVLAAVKTAEIEAPKATVSNEPLMDAAALAGSKVKKEEAGEFGTTVWTLENGMQIIVKPTEYKKDEIMMKTVANGGRSILADELMPSFESNIFATYLNSSGVSKFPESQLTKMLTGKVVGVSPYIGELEHGVSASGSPKDLETMMQLMYLYYTAPRFEASEFEAGFNQVKAIIPNLLKQPNMVFSKVLQETMLSNSPRRPFISEEMLEKVSIENIKKGYTQLMAAQTGLKVYITGNVNLEELKPMVEKYIGSLPALSRKGTSWVDEGIQAPKGIQKNHFTTPMETPKTSVAIIYNGTMEKNLENDVKMSVLSSVLDQLYTKTIREDEGGTYGVSTMAEIGGEPKPEFAIMIIFDTDETKAPKLIELAKQGLKDIAQNGPNAEYVTKARENMIKAFPERQIHNSYWHNLAYQWYSHGRNNFNNYIETVEKVATPESIQKFVQEILSQGNEFELVMNPAK